MTQTELDKFVEDLRKYREKLEARANTCFTREYDDLHERLANVVAYAANRAYDSFLDALPMYVRSLLDGESMEEAMSDFLFEQITDGYQYDEAVIPDPDDS